jgi:translocator protein
MCDNKLEIARIVGASALPLVGCVIAGSGVDPEKAMTEWYDKLKQPRLTPPNWVYSAVWGYLYPTTGYASYLVWKTGGGFEGAARGPLMLYGATLGLNWAFSPLYFGRRDVKAVS